MFRNYIILKKENMDLEINIPNYSKRKTVKFSEAVYESVKEALARGKLDELFMYTSVNNEKSYIMAIKWILVFGVIPAIKSDKENEADLNRAFKKLLFINPDKEYFVANIIRISKKLEEEKEGFKINWNKDLIKLIGEEQ